MPRQPERKCGDSIPKMVWLGRSDNTSGDCRLAEHPRKRHLSARNAPLFRHLDQGIDDFTVSSFRLRVQGLAELVSLKALGFLYAREDQTSVSDLRSSSHVWLSGSNGGC